MIRIAVLGEIGSGKSFFAKQLKIPLFCADEVVKSLYSKSRFLFTKLKKAFPKNFEKLSSDTRTQQIEIDTLLTNYLLSSQGDRMSMANSVEGRYPYLDDQFTKFCSEIDPAVKAFGIRSLSSSK